MDKPKIPGSAPDFVVRDVNKQEGKEFSSGKIFFSAPDGKVVIYDTLKGEASVMGQSELDKNRSERIKVPEGTIFFKNSDGNILAINENDSKAFLSKDGVVFYELLLGKIEKYSSLGKDRKRGEFKNLHDRSYGDIELDLSDNSARISPGNRELYYAGFLSDEFREEMDLVKSPEDEEVYYFILEDGSHLRVFRGEGANLKFFMNGRELKQTQTPKINKGGGNTYYTEEGTFHTPTIMHRGNPEWIDITRKRGSIVETRIFN